MRQALLRAANPQDMAPRARTDAQGAPPEHGEELVQGALEPVTQGACGGSLMAISQTQSCAPGCPTALRAAPPRSFQRNPSPPSRGPRARPGAGLEPAVPPPRRRRPQPLDGAAPTSKAGAPQRPGRPWRPRAAAAPAFPQRRRRPWRKRVSELPGSRIRSRSGHGGPALRLPPPQDAAAGQPPTEAPLRGGDAPAGASRHRLRQRQQRRRPPRPCVSAAPGIAGLRPLRAEQSPGLGRRLPALPRSLGEGALRPPPPRGPAPEESERSRGSPAPPAQTAPAEDDRPASQLSWSLPASPPPPRPGLWRGSRPPARGEGSALPRRDFAGSPGPRGQLGRTRLPEDTLRFTASSSPEKAGDRPPGDSSILPRRDFEGHPQFPPSTLLPLPPFPTEGIFTQRRIFWFRPRCEEYFVLGRGGFHTGI
ncbi:basic salivary proline-rich protein 3-like [Molothrus ater]|uniref:basic salivary proline-rich protein 3-like n=1 Tax=Molothrus ater TaxID=84834 RepID=UPI0023E76657|nr:basic salivary proline-rich protein 3-like [Molothrus ater]